MTTFVSYLDITTRNSGEEINDFTFIYKDFGDRREMLCVYKEDDRNCIVMHDNALPVGQTHEIRSDGLWSDFNNEAQDHWSLSMESFALRMPIDEYLASHKQGSAITVGERVPFGYELDCIEEDGKWNLEGMILVGKDEIDVNYSDIELVVMPASE